LTRPAGIGKLKPDGFSRVIFEVANFVEQLMSVQDEIKKQVTGNKVVLYMKGSPDFPQCGFSANAINILRACGVNEMFTVNVLENPEIRQGIKQYANWPTIPQLYVDGEFVGGSDIVTELYQSGELQKMLQP
jgi:monothiol glutaredoxin